MIGLYVTVPIACFRRGLAREYLENGAIAAPLDLLRLPAVAGR